MKTLKQVFVILSLVILGNLLLTCNKEEDKTAATENDVSFSIDASSLKSMSSLKSTAAYSLADADKIVLTIKNSDGTATKYTSYEVKIQRMNGNYFTEKIMLKTGKYNLTEFLVLDSADSTIFVAPLVGSLEAQNVSNPLSIAFVVSKNITSSVVVEVVSTEKKKPEDFGLTRFAIVEVKTFGFMIGVVDRETDKAIPAKIKVSSGRYIYTQNLDSVLNNVVTVKDGFKSYTITIEKEGYEIYTYTYSLDSIKKYTLTIGNLSILVDLIKKLFVFDCDGNIYSSVTIGTQRWMNENLKTTKYNDCSPIPLVTGTNLISTPGYAWYENNEAAYKNTYGALYNWYAVNTGKLCPTGWHVPSIDEWRLLENYLGGWAVAGGKLKESGLAHWNSPNTGATNETGFTALPGSYYGGTEAFGIMGDKGFWWSSTESHYVYDFLVGDIEGDAYYNCMEYNNTKSSTNSDYPGDTFGMMYRLFSVRCLKN